MAHGAPGEPGADAEPWSPELNAADYRETLRKAKHHDALVEALERYVESDGYEDEIKEQGRAALDAAKEA